MVFNELNSGYVRRKHPGGAVVAGFTSLAVLGAVSTVALMTAGAVADAYNPQFVLAAVLDRANELRLYGMDEQAWKCAQLGLAIGAISSAITGMQFWRQAPRTEPFRTEDPTDPRIFYDEDAQVALKNRLCMKAGAGRLDGLYIAPHLPLSKRLERRNVIIVGAPSSGKSNILRPIAQQAIARGDLVVLHCTKGEVTGSFRRSDIVLLSPTNKNGWAWDIGADIDSPPAAYEFAVTVIEESKEVFFSNTARLVFADIITALGRESGSTWGPRELLVRILSTPNELAEMIGSLDLSASPLITSSDPEEVSRTVESIIATLVSGALTTLRPMALAWTGLPPSRKFSIKAMLSPRWNGPRVLIVQSHPAFEVLSRSVCGGALRYLCQQIAAPRGKPNNHPTVTMVLDEFRSLGRIEGLDRCLSVAREQGLSMTIALQSLSQLKDLYGDAASTLEGLFQFKVYAMQDAGEATNALSSTLGKRKITVTLPNRLPKSDDKRKWVSERQDYPLFSPTQFSRDLGNFHPDTPKEVITALLTFEGEAYQLDWPPTKWQRQSNGYVPAQWTTRLVGAKPERQATKIPLGGGGSQAGLRPTQSGAVRKQ